MSIADEQAEKDVCGRDIGSADGTSSVLSSKPDLGEGHCVPRSQAGSLICEEKPSVGESTENDKDGHPQSPAPVLSQEWTKLIVPLRTRRGLFSFLSYIPELSDPRVYSRKTKWTITFIVALAALAAPLGSAIILPALVDISHSLGSAPSITNLSVALYMLAMSIFPLWWSSFSETLGRRSIYIVSFALFTVWAILAAVSTSISMFVAFRLFSGGAAASVQAVGAGTIADIWEVKERGRAMGIFYLGPLCGPLFAPILGGALTQNLGWRSTQWFLVAYGGLTTVGLIFCLPETLRSRESAAERDRIASSTKVSENGEAARDEARLYRVSTGQSAHLKAQKWISFLRRYLLDPLKILLDLRFPAVALTVYYASITFGSLYFLNVSIQDTFSQPPYSFSTMVVGLLYIPNSLGYILASVFGGNWADKIMAREAEKAGRYDEKGKLIYRPEDRLRENAWLAAFVFPGALIWYGWTAEKGIFWFVPVLSNFFFGVGSMIIFATTTTMLTEFMPHRASNGIALNNFVRNIFSCVGAVIAEPLVSAIGNGWLCTGLGLIALLTGMGTIMAIRRYGYRWRDKLEKEMS